MLVIRRRAGESVVLSGGIEVVVLESGQHGVKLGFNAPAEVVVLRKEIQLAQESNLAAAEAARDVGALRRLARRRFGVGGEGAAEKKDERPPN
ncbi:MAG: carbon storage regulator [Candidatus Solibacter sp.]|nr:carbon storage regulator [Candidatus Solibacter sp.]